MEPISASALGALVTTICLAVSTFAAVCFKGLSHSRCSKVVVPCCFSCDREVMTPAEIAAAEAAGQ